MGKKELRHYRYSDTSITREEAVNKYPRPRFFDRPSESMSLDELRAMLLRNVQEIEAILHLEKQIATGNCNGRITKRDLVDAANRFHDWRVGMNIISGGLGEPCLWEE